MPHMPLCIFIYSTFMNQRLQFTLVYKLVQQQTVALQSLFGLVWKQGRPNTGRKTSHKEINGNKCLIQVVPRWIACSPREKAEIPEGLKAGVQGFKFPN
jgi:hypothetical protein